MRKKIIKVLRSWLDDDQDSGAISIINALREAGFEITKIEE